MNGYVRIDCPGCGRTLRARPEHMGHRLRCRQCRHRFRAAADVGTMKLSKPSDDLAEEPRRLEFRCPGCRRAVRVRSGYVGRVVQCRRCGQAFRPQAGADAESITRAEQQPLPRGTAFGRSSSEILATQGRSVEAAPGHAMWPISVERESAGSTDRPIFGPSVPFAEAEQPRDDAAEVPGQMEIGQTGAEVLQTPPRSSRPLAITEWERIVLANLDEPRERVDRAVARLEREWEAEAEAIRATCRLLGPELDMARERVETSRSEADELRRQVKSLVEIVGQRDAATAALQEEVEQLSRSCARSAEEAELVAAEVDIWRTRHDAERARRAEGEHHREACDRLAREAELLRGERNAACERAATARCERDEFAERCKQAESRAAELSTHLSLARACESDLVEAGQRQQDELDRLRRQLLSACEQAGGAERSHAEAEARICGLEAEIEGLRQAAEAAGSEYLRALEDQREEADADRRRSDELILAARQEQLRVIAELQEEFATLQMAATELRQERDEAALRAEVLGRERGELAGHLGEARSALEAAEQNRGEVVQLRDLLARAREAQHASSTHAEELCDRLLSVEVELEQARREVESARAELELATAAHREQLEGEARRHQESIHAAQRQADQEISVLRAHTERLAQQVDVLRRDRDRLAQFRESAGQLPTPMYLADGERTCLPGERQGHEPIHHRVSESVARPEGGLEANARRGLLRRDVGTGDGSFGGVKLGTPDDPAAVTVGDDHRCGANVPREEGAYDLLSHDGMDPVLELALEQIGAEDRSVIDPQGQSEACGNCSPPVSNCQGDDLSTDPGDGPFVRESADGGPEVELHRLECDCVRLHEQGRLNEALEVVGRVVNLTRATFGEHNADYAAALMAQARLLFDHGDLDQAARLQERAEVVFRETLEADHPDYIVCLCDAAELSEARGETERARRLYERAAPLAIRRFGECHPISRLITGRLINLCGGWGPPAIHPGVICVDAGPAALFAASAPDIRPEQ